MYVFCVHIYSYIPVSRTSLRTRSTVLRFTPSAAAVRSLCFSKHIFKFPLFFTLSKITYIDYYLLQVRCDCFSLWHIDCM